MTNYCGECARWVGSSDIDYDGRRWCPYSEKYEEACQNAKDCITMKVFFFGYRIAAGIARILNAAHEGCKSWFKPIRQKFKQLSFLTA